MPHTSAIDALFDEFTERPWTGAVSEEGVEPEAVLVGSGNTPIEVAIATAASRPSRGAMDRVWKERWGNRPNALLLIVCYTDSGQRRVAVSGLRDRATSLLDLSEDVVGALVGEALQVADAAAAERVLALLLASGEHQGIAGVRNEGLFSVQELAHGARSLPEWGPAADKGRALSRHGGVELLRSLGWTVEGFGSSGLVLKTGYAAAAAAIVLDESETPDRAVSRFAGQSPAAVGLALAREIQVKWLVVVQPRSLRLYPTKPELATAYRGDGETYFEVFLPLVAAEDWPFIPLIFSPAGLESGAVERLIRASREHAAALETRLRERVYQDAVPLLAQSFASRLGAQSRDELDQAFHYALIALFRLLFVAYAEDGGLLPHHSNEAYSRRSLKTTAQELVHSTSGPDTTSTSRWNGLQEIWSAIDEGNADWGIPPYNGGLFSHADSSGAGRFLAEAKLTNAEVAPILEALLIDQGADGVRGPVDFRSLTVREFGTIYEGLLEQSLSLAEVDLLVEPGGTYRPARAEETPDVRRGEVYLHNASGARKSTGSYFTKSFAVEHLLDGSLEPALTAHLAKVQALLDSDDEAAAAKQFFDFRVVDLAMGSGHFLVASIDRIEAAFSSFLATHPIASVLNELSNLQVAADEQLASVGRAESIESSRLLRRQIARRCIYGVDINEIAVELTRLGIWIHTFVPGLSMASLNHGLVHGNSLSGVLSIDEALQVLDGSSQERPSLIARGLLESLSASAELLERVATASEATAVDSKAAASQYDEARTTAAPASRLFDAVVAARLGLLEPRNYFDADEIVEAASRPLIAGEVAALQPVHFPFAFPEVFVGDNVGFDVVLGNPPWDKVRWEPVPFWTAVVPGLQSLNGDARESEIARLRVTYPSEAAEETRRSELRERERTIYRDAYTLRGGTHLEYAQLMLERAVRALNADGRIGIVLPRQFTVLAGWAKLRAYLIEFHDLDIIQGRNKHEWIFEAIHESYAVVLLTIAPVQASEVRVSVAKSPEDVRHHAETAVVLTANTLAELSESMAIPWFNEPQEVQIFDVMKAAPTLSDAQGWVTAHHDARWDFRGTGPDRLLATPAAEDSEWRVMMTRHLDAYALNLRHRFDKTLDQHLPGAVAKRRGLVDQDGRFVLGADHPLIIVRHPSRSDDSRTIIASALPEAGFVHNKGYVHAISVTRGSDARTQLALLGLLNTFVLDWWTRRFVDRHVTAPVVNFVRIANWSESDLDAASKLAASLLARSGYSTLAGGVSVSDQHAGQSDIELRAALERLAVRGYGLEEDALSVIAADFNTTGVPNALLDALGATRGVNND